jgi:hypothetical protein
MTPEQEKALTEIQKAFVAMPETESMLAGYAALLANTPADDIERQCNNIGHCFYLTLQQTAPDMSEAMQLGLPYAISRLLLQRMQKAN